MSTHLRKLQADSLADKAAHMIRSAIFEGHIQPEERLTIEHIAAQLGISQTAVRSDAVMRKHNALARRLIDRQDDYLRFTQDWRIPPHNNGSERDIRMIKLQQKVSGCLRSLTGARQFCAIRSYLATAAKHGRVYELTPVAG